MVSHMKTTVNLPDPLLDEARKAARRDGVTFKELLEVSLQREIERREREARAPFRLGGFVVEGSGVRAEVREGDWFDLIYREPGADR
jgi:hypothetical protein